MKARDTAVFIRDALFNTETQHESVFVVPLQSDNYLKDVTILHDIFHKTPRIIREPLSFVTS